MSFKGSATIVLKLYFFSSDAKLNKEAATILSLENLQNCLSTLGVRAETLSLFIKEFSNDDVLAMLCPEFCYEAAEAERRINAENNLFEDD